MFLGEDYVLNIPLVPLLNLQSINNFQIIDFYEKIRYKRLLVVSPTIMGCRYMYLRGPVNICTCFKV